MGEGNSYYELGIDPKNILWHPRMNVVDPFCKRTKKIRPRKKKTRKMFFVYFYFAVEFPGGKSQGKHLITQFQFLIPNF